MAEILIVAVAIVVVAGDASWPEVRRRYLSHADPTDGAR